MKEDSTNARAPIDAANDALSVKRVFGEPYSDGDATIIPVAKALGGSGMGFGGGSGPHYSDSEDGAEGFGGGGGFGVRVRPLGVYVIRDGRVDFKPTIDVNRAIIGGQIAVAVVAVAVAWACRGRARWRRQS